MIVRIYSPNDLDAVKDIHEQHYSKEFDLHDLFDNHALEKVVVTDLNDQIITVGALRTLVEVVAVTDMKYSPRERASALIRLLESLRFITKTYDYDSMHCFPLGSKEWQEQLIKYGFSPTRGQCLSIGVEHG